MNKRQQHRLIKELRTAGASAPDAQQLAELANGFVLLRDALGQARRLHVTLQKPLSFGISGCIGFLAGCLVVVYAQTVLPNSSLYLVQKVSDNLAVSFDPSYRGTIMMKRAEQVKELVHEKADAEVVLATLSDYQTEASTYKDSATNYAMFDYCKNSLQQAAAQSSGNERQAIEKTLSTLTDV